MKLLFNPHTGLWAHTAPEAYLARSLKELGHDISYLGCGKIQNYCSVISAWGIYPNSLKEKYSNKCAKLNKKTLKAISKFYGIPFQMLDNFIDNHELNSINQVVSKTISNKSLNLIYLDIKVGKLALYELILQHKKMTINLTEEQWKEYEVYLKNSLILLKSFSNFCKKNSPEVILSFSPQYSNINPAMQYAQKRDIKVLFMESGTNLSDRLSTLRVWDWRIHKLVNPGLKYWKSETKYHVTKRSVNGIINHYKELLKGNHFSVFSSTNKNHFDIKKEWNISLNKKVLLMTLSSYDEAFAALVIGAFPYQKVFSDVFKTQFEWIEETIKWVKNRKDLFLIIRVHPRDFPNKRDSIRSEQSYLLEKVLKAVPKNVKVNWPRENVSLYQILESTDVLLTGWSVTALEALILGIPVVTYDSKLPSYPKDIYYSGRSMDKYFKNIKKAINDGWDFKNVRNGFRWLSFNFNYCTIKVSKDFGSFERNKLSG